MEEACLSGSIEKVLELIKNGNTSWTKGLVGACEGGHLQLAQLMVSKGANYRGPWSFICACRSGNWDLVMYLISLGRDDWELGLYGACFGGHKNLVDFFISKGAIYFDGGLYGACKGGHLHLIKFLISENKSIYRVMYRKIMYSGIPYGYYIDLEQAFITACTYGHIDIVKYMLKIGTYDMNKGLYASLEHKWNIQRDYEIANYLIRQGAVYKNDNYDFDMYNKEKITKILEIVTKGGDITYIVLEYLYKR
jgi:hypothetical protein